MSVYRHVTNLATPFDKADKAFLDKLPDYKLTDPVKANPEPDMPPPNDVPTMKRNGIVGLYTTFEAVSEPEAVKLHGWKITPAQWATLPEWPF